MTAQAQTAGADEDQSENGRECEWQLSAGDLGIVRQWLTEHDAVEGFTIESRPTQSIYDTYLDTEDWRVHRAGFALRLRDMPGEAQATLKDLSPARSDGFKSRREYTEPLESAEEHALAQGQGPVSIRIQAMAGAHPLRAKFRVRTQRQRFALLEPTGEAGEIALDETTVASIDGRSNTRLRRVEVEAWTGAPQNLERFVERLRAECALEPAIDSKFDAGLKSAGLAVPSAPTPESPTTREVAQTALLEGVSNWLACEAGARVGEDPEQLHDMRVAGRRLDASIRLFEDYLPVSSKELRPRLKAMMSAMGAVRDLDVHLTELAAFSDDLPQADRQWLQPLRDRIWQERRGARERMLDLLDRQSTQRMMQGLLTQLTGPPEGVESDEPPAATVAPELIGAQYKKLCKDAKQLRKNSTPEEFHRVRRRVKHLRYAIDAFGELHGKAADDLLRALRRLQNTLGAHQEAAVMGRRLNDIATEQPALPSQTQFLMGALCERHRAIGQDLRRRFPKDLRKVTGRRWKALRKAMDDLALGAARKT